jgi:hypothetical protein
MAHGIHAEAVERMSRWFEALLNTPSHHRGPRCTVDLNQPEALQRLARENPFHFAMIRRILAGVDTVPEHTVGRWMKAQFNATDVTYSPVLLTSDPPKKLLAFTLETTHYSALLSLTPDGARLVALRR